MGVMDNKVVRCIDCGEDVLVSKFASAKMTRCPECKANAFGPTGNRKRKGTQSTKGTKQWAIDGLLAVLDVYEIIDNVIDKGIEQGVIKSGWKSAHGLTNTFAFNWLNGTGECGPCKLYGNGRKKAKVWDYQYHTKQTKVAACKIGWELIERDVKMGYDEFIACKYQIRESDFIQYAIRTGMVDGIWEENVEDQLAENDYTLAEAVAAAKERAATDLEDNEIDEWASRNKEGALRR